MNITLIVNKFISLFVLLCLLAGCKKQTVPTVTTSDASSITSTSAITGGNVVDDGNSSVHLRGICWNETGDPTISDNKTIDGLGTGEFTSSLTGLKIATEYYLRAYAKNDIGISYGNTITFSTSPAAPKNSYFALSNLTINSVLINAKVNPNALATTIIFEYGPTTSYGNLAEPIQNPITGKIDSDVSLNLTGLNPRSTYHVRLKATNSIGTIYSNDMQFTTLGDVPGFTTKNPSNVSVSTITINALINPYYLPSTVIFEYGTDTNYGNQINLTQTPLTGGTDVALSVDLSSLTNLTRYHYRFIAENQLGITISGDLMFSTTGTLTDIDGNSYKTVLIGDQKWMGENLRTKRFANGDPVFNGESVSNNCDTKPYYFNYNLDPANSAIYGLLYNYYAASGSKAIATIVSDLIPSGVQGVCPNGWHLPSWPEYQVMIDFLGGKDVAGGKIKSTQLWEGGIGVGVTNESNFTALPAGGYDKENSGYAGMGRNTSVWSTSGDSDYHNVLYLNYLNVTAPPSWASHRCQGASVRCIKN